MTEEKKTPPAAPAPATPAPAAAGAPPAAPKDPETEIKGRIEALQKEIRTLKQDMVNMNGKIMNLDPQAVKKLLEKNTELQTRKDSLIRALFALHADSGAARTAEDEKLRCEAIRLAAVEYFKKANVDPELWKSLES